MSRRVILVTGANGGLGQAIARAFLAENAENVVWLGVRANRVAVDALTKEFAARAHIIELDVTSPEHWKRAVDSILAEQKRLDVLVNNAGHHADSLLATVPRESWDCVMASALHSVFHGCQAVMPTMISQRSGRIVNIASLSALLAPAGQTNYA